MAEYSIVEFFLRNEIIIKEEIFPEITLINYYVKIINIRRRIDFGKNYVQIGFSPARFGAFRAPN